MKNEKNCKILEVKTKKQKKERRRSKFNCQNNRAIPTNLRLA